ncbi:MAG: hypothetical protein ABR583_03400 [Gaiellaceae bacterium]
MEQLRTPVARLVPRLAAIDASPPMWFAVAGIAGMLIGALGPWASLAPLSASGTDEVGGWIVLVGGVLGVVSLATYMRFHRRLMLLGVLVAGVAGSVTTVYERNRSATLLDVEDSEFFTRFVRIDWGLDLAFAASILVTLAPVLLLARREPAADD